MRDQLYELVIKYIHGFPDIDASLLPDSMRLARSIREVHSSEEKYLERYGVSPRSFNVLEILFLYPDQGVTPAELADMVMVSRASMTNTLDGLERMEYVCRVQHPRDRRMILVQLTPAGRDYIQEHLPKHYRSFVKVLKHLTPEELVTLVSLYEKLARGVREMLEELE